MTVLFVRKPLTMWERLRGTSVRQQDDARCSFARLIRTHVLSNVPWSHLHCSLVLH